MSLTFRDSANIKRCIDSEIDENHPIVKAMHNKELIFFIGSGLSVHLGMPNWSEFASKYVKFISDKADINYKTQNDLRNISDKKKVLSLCRFIAKSNNIDESEVRTWFNIEEKNLNNNLDIYNKLYGLGAIYVTTNYDNALDLMIINKEESDLGIGSDYKDKLHENKENKKVYYRVEEFKSEKIMKSGNVIHIHGSKESLESMVISNEDYINRYGYSMISNKEGTIQYLYSEFLKDIFNDKYTILFIGYGLEEIEILQYMFENTLENREGINNRYMLLGGYASDYGYIDILSKYYYNNYGVKILPYDITEEGHDLEIYRVLSKLEEWKTNKRAKLKAGLDLMEGI